MKQTYILTVGADEKYQPESEEITHAIMDVIRKKVDEDPNRAEKGDFEVGLVPQNLFDALEGDVT